MSCCHVSTAKIKSSRNTNIDLGILKNSVPDYIKNNVELMRFINEIRDADINDGGSGAFYIFLKKKL